MDRSGLCASAERSGRTRTVAIVGASGYIGKQLVEKLLRVGGFRIKLLARSLDQNTPVGGSDAAVEVFKGDLQEPETLQDFLEPDCTVINLVYLWTGGEAANLAVITNLLDACKVAKVGRLIHCSTAAVVGRVEDDVISESTPCRPVTEYGVTKLKVEQVIIEAGKGAFDVAILRPTAVFGPGGDPLKKLAGDIVSGSRLRNYLKSCLFGKRRTNLVPVANVVGAFIFLMCYEKELGGEVFIVSDDDSPINNFADVEDFLMSKFGIEKYAFPRIPLPLALLASLLRAMGRNNINPRCNFAQDKLKNLGFVRTATFEDALGEYAEWYRSTQLGKV